MIALHRKVIAARKLRGWSQKVFSKWSHLSLSTIKVFETGKKVYDDTIRQIEWSVKAFLCVDILDNGIGYCDMGVYHTITVEPK